MKRDDLLSFGCGGNKVRKLQTVIAEAQAQGKEIPARLVDAGDADVEVHSGDWAIIKTKELDLPALRPDTSFGYDFAEPIFRDSL